ncbi:Signal transduction histidine kinase [Micromonospora phaseoli]|uniref:histidine kinase n=1 Tax=Micromonospora phaseoli TaxID=1144548 RepID=A0A1H7AWY0_9ACTN|nr:histidine kinase [Micromonospora phaseoli]PZV96206.1 signal transduction histidine kinase [Micromonospora phaseoli]GIJ79482.1 histidine kinase [Micromonospora phaseoli]SEJ68427.1 Signal transduction histidine kinase [Micromonospora phaseoli]
MTPVSSSHLAQALRHPRYLRTAWPWRALAYLLTTAPLAAVLSIGPLVVVAPLFAAVGAVQRHDRPVPLALAAFLAVCGLFVVALAPLLSAPVAAFERYRLGLVDGRPVAGQPWRGVAARYVTAGAWREAAYLFWLGGVVPVVYWIFAVLVMLDVLLIVSPFVAGTGGEVVLVWATVDSPAQAVPHAIVGLLLAPVLWYAAGALAAAQAVVARWLLRGTLDGAALREVTRSRARLVDAYEAERRRIERDLHDGAQPRLTSLSLQIGLARLDVPDDSPAAGPLAVAHEQAMGLMTLLRQIVRGIRPQSLTDLGLAGAVRELADEAPVPVEVHAELPRPLPEAAETTAYFVVSEVLGNIARHAQATHAQVRLTDTGAGLVVEISDDGRGGADPARGSGLTGLADRVAAADGRLLLASPPGGPTLVRVELPWSA